MRKFNVFKREAISVEDDSTYIALRGILASVKEFRAGRSGVMFLMASEVRPDREINADNAEAFFGELQDEFGEKYPELFETPEASEAS